MCVSVSPGCSLTCSSLGPGSFPIVGLGRRGPLSLSCQNQFGGQLQGVEVFLSHLSATISATHPMGGGTFQGEGGQPHRLPGTALT